MENRKSLAKSSTVRFIAEKPDKIVTPAINNLTSQSRLDKKT